MPPIATQRAERAASETAPLPSSRLRTAPAPDAAEADAAIATAIATIPVDTSHTACLADD